MQLKLVTVNFQLSSPQSWWWGSHGIYCVFRQKCPQKSTYCIKWRSTAALPEWPPGGGGGIFSLSPKGFGEHLGLIYKCFDAVKLYQHSTSSKPKGCMPGSWPLAHDGWAISTEFSAAPILGVTQPYNPHFWLTFLWIHFWSNLGSLWRSTLCGSEGPLFSSPISWAVFRFARWRILRQPTCYLSIETRFVEKEFQLGVKDKYSEIFDNYERTSHLKVNVTN